MDAPMAQETPKPAGDDSDSEFEIPTFVKPPAAADATPANGDTQISDVQTSVSGPSVGSEGGAKIDGAKPSAAEVLLAGNSGTVAGSAVSPRTPSKETVSPTIGSPNAALIVAGGNESAGALSIPDLPGSPTKDTIPLQSASASGTSDAIFTTLPAASSNSTLVAAPAIATGTTASPSSPTVTGSAEPVPLPAETVAVPATTAAVPAGGSGDSRAPSTPAVSPPATTETTKNAPEKTPSEAATENGPKAGPIVIAPLGKMLIDLPPLPSLHRKKQIIPDDEGESTTTPGRSRDEANDDFLRGSSNDTDAHKVSRAEWDAIDKLQQERPVEKEGQIGIRTREISRATPIRFNEVMIFFHDENLDAERAKIVTTVQRGCCGAFFQCLCGPPKYRASLISDRDLLFAMGKVKLDDAKLEHIRILNTIYMGLTGNQLDCPRYGTHWDVIGFQDTDPATDLRGVGMLGLVQMLYFIQVYRDAALATYRLSVHRDMNFPFAITGLNITKMVVEALRENILSKEANEREDVILAAMDLYSAGFHLLHLNWKRDQNTITDAGYVLDTLRTTLRTHPRRTIEEFRAHLARRDAPIGDEIELPTVDL